MMSDLGHMVQATRHVDRYARYHQGTSGSVRSTVAVTVCPPFVTVTSSPGWSWRPRRVSTSPLTLTIPDAISSRACPPVSARLANLRYWPSLIIWSSCTPSLCHDDTTFHSTESINPRRRLDFGLPMT